MKNLVYKSSSFGLTFILGVLVSMLVTGAFRSLVHTATQPNDVTDITVNYRTCELHLVPMYQEQVHVLCNPLPFPYEYNLAMKRLFPNSNLYSIERNPNGCQRYSTVFVCPKCRAAELEWYKNPNRYSMHIDSAPPPNNLFNRSAR